MDTESINNVYEYAVEELDELELEYDVVLGLLKKVQQRHSDFVCDLGDMQTGKMKKYQSMKDKVNKFSLNQLKKRASKEEMAFYIYLKKKFDYDIIKQQINNEFSIGIDLISLDTDNSLKKCNQYYMYRLTQQLSDISSIREEDEKDIFEYLDNNKWLEELRQLGLTNQVRKIKYQLYMTKKEQEALLNNFTYKKYEGEYFLKRD